MDTSEDFFTYKPVNFKALLSLFHSFAFFLGLLFPSLHLLIQQLQSKLIVPPLQFVSEKIYCCEKDHLITS